MAGALAGLAAVVVVVTRLFGVADGDVGRFVVAGSAWVDAEVVPTDVDVIDGAGYDGQFGHRLAIDPTELTLDERHGVRIDSPVRAARIAYPLASRAAALGQVSLLPWGHVAVNVGGLAALGALGAVVARAHGRHGLYGLLLPGYFGFVFVLARDLTEITEATFVVAGLVALRRERTILATAALCLAVLGREQAVLVPVAIGLVAVSERVRGRRAWGPAPADAVWLVPGVVVLAWQITLTRVYDRVPALAADNDTGPPLLGLARSAREWLGDAVDLGAPASEIVVGWQHVGQAVLVATVVGLALIHIRASDAPDHEKVALVLYAGLAALLTTDVLADPADFRTVADLVMVALLIVISAPVRLRAIAAGTGALWVAGALARTVWI